MYLTHKDLDKYWYIDIETDSLTPSRIWCAVVKHIATGETHSLVGHDDIRGFINAHPEAIWVGHNIVSFDAHWLSVRLGVSLPVSRLVDTLVLSWLYHPSMPNGHSLEAWGERLKFPKQEFNDWSEFSPRMLEYCRNDVELGVKIFKALTGRMLKTGFSEKSCELEHQIRYVVDKQERNGFWFDVESAEKLYANLRMTEQELAGPIRQLFPAQLVEKNRYTYREKKDGSPTHHYLRHKEQYDQLVHNQDGTYSVFLSEDFNIGSSKQRVARLLELGWEPESFTPTGAPKVDEDSIIKFAEEQNDERISAIAEWLVANGRANMLNTWLECVSDDSRIRGRVFTCGANTRRMRHSRPNTANIPGNEARYGREVRSLWGVPPASGRVLVGYDAAALEMRMFGHYIGGGAAADLYIKGDPHTVNAGLLGHDRRQAKTDFYAFLYGASNRKLGSVHGKSAEYGKRIRKTLVESTPGLARLVDSVQQECERYGRLECIDGGFVRCELPHAALNYKLQSAGALAMKQASVFLDREAERRGLDHKKVGDIHDEGQHEVAEADAEEFGKLAVQCIRDAGEELGFCVPLDGDFKIGKTWAETH